MDELTNDPINEGMDETFTEPISDNTAEIPVDAAQDAPADENRPVNPRRRKKTKLQIFKETQLPLIILAVTAVLLLIFIFGSIGRAVNKFKAERDASIAASESIAQRDAAYAAEVERLLKTAEQQAAGYDYLGAIATIDSFSGDIAAYEQLMTKRAEYQELQRSVQEWSNPNDVTNLSFHPLIADPSVAFANNIYGGTDGSYNENFITVNEFSAILEQLYANGYMLVELEDFIGTTKGADGSITYEAQSVYLPAGKKPLMITQTHCNYYNYMADSDEDGEIDAGGSGFASKLIIGADGKLANEMIAADGSTVTGAYDLVPILEAFIEAHPDFSYGGARATLAFTGYDGLFGYRTSALNKENMEEADYNAELQAATTVLSALRSKGYHLACNTYQNRAYGEMDNDSIQEDLNAWANEVTPLLGSVDTLVYASDSDILDDTGAYSSDTYELLKAAGFKYFIGFCDSGSRWVHVGGDYVRQGRIMVTGYNLNANSTWFSGMFDTATVIDSARPE